MNSFSMSAVVILVHTLPGFCHLIVTVAMENDADKVL